jgi:ketosteroid isomerase-like protein
MLKLLTAVALSVLPTATAFAQSEKLTPKQIVTNMIELMRSGQTVKSMETYYADDFNVVVPFALPEPTDLHGKDHILDLVKQAEAARGPELPRMYRNLEVRDLKIYETTDPGVVIAEWVYRSHIGDKVVDNSNIIVVTVRDGKIVKSRDYHDSVRRAIGNGTANKTIGVIKGMILPGDPQP